MKYQFAIALALGASFLAMPAKAELKRQPVTYKDGETTLEGYLVYDDKVTGKRPGILVVHEWWGLNGYAKKRADMLAELGYVAFAADIYGKGVRPTTPQDAGREAGKYVNNRPLMRERAKAALDVLRHQEMVDPAKLVAIGYCFGGTTVLELARSGADLAGVVSFHGILATPTPEDAQNIHARVAVFTGADDAAVPPEQVAAFEKEMTDAKVDWQLTSYGGAVHGFTNPANGPREPGKNLAYDEKADKRSWAAFQSFLNELFGT